MKESSSQPPIAPDSSGKEKPEIGVGPILGLALFLGLMIGAATDKSHILPATLICAIILYTNRHKIAAQDTPNSTSHNASPTPKIYYAWPESKQYAVTISAVPYQQEIQQLAQENPVNPDSTGTKRRFFLALLEPVNDNPYDDNVIRVDIGEHTVGYLSYDQAQRFRKLLKDHQLSNQITTCMAVLIENAETQTDQTVRYGIKLDLALPA
ncbi:MAG: hypothetical protein IT524_00190 [Nitrosomonas sp.]|nr:hypothetical protein [Nitrosomonas sp.]